MSIPNIDIGGWEIYEDAYWQSDPYLFSLEMDTLSICNKFIDDHVNKTEIPYRLIDSYRSYLIQSVKDIDHQVNALLMGRDQREDQIAFSVDSSIAKAQPWRFTCYLQRFISNQLNYENIKNIDPSRILTVAEALLEQAFLNGSLYRIDKYIKVSHVLMDISYDIGWDTVYQKTSYLKQTEGLNTNPERVATLRDITLFIGRSFWNRNFFDSARQICLMGFPDISNVIANLEKNELGEILTKMNSREAVHFLFTKHDPESNKKNNCNEIADGALRMIGNRKLA